MRSFAASLSCLALVLFAASPAMASERYAGSPAPLPQGDKLVRVRQHLEQRKLELGLDRVELGGARTQGRSGRVVRFEQQVGGVPVIGGGVSVRVDGGRVQAISVDVDATLTVDPTPSLLREEAEVALADALGVSVAAEKAELAIMRIDGGLLVWQLDVRDTLGGTRYFIDAHSGVLVAERPLAVHALGRVYTMNSVETPTPADVTLDLLDSADPQHLNGWSGLLAVTNAIGGDSQNGFTVEQTLTPNSGTDFLYDPPANPLDATDGFAQVNLFFHLSTMRSFFEALGVDQTAASWKLTAVANAKDGNQPLDNAFFSPMGQSGTFAAPNLIAIGQGSVGDFAYDSDVFKHEFGHYVTGNAINYNLGQGNFDELGLNPFSGSIDEGIADYFACSENNDAELGEASLSPLGAGRDLTNTSKKCPDDMIAEVHADGELIGSMSWSIREAVGQAAGDRIIWGALETLMPGASFDDFSKGIVEATQALVDDGTLTAADLTTVQGILAERGMDDCGRIVGLSPGESSKGTVFGLNLIGQLFGVSCSQAQGFGIKLPSLFHYGWTPAASDVGVKLTVDATALEPGEIVVTVYGRKSLPVGFSPMQGGIPVVTDFDYQVAITNGLGELVIDASSDPPFDPSATYDFVLSSESCPTVGFTVSAASYTPTTGTGGGGTGGSAGTGGSTANGTGGGTGGESDTDDGCGCAVGGGSESSLGYLAGLGALAAVGLRRRSGNARRER